MKIAFYSVTRNKIEGTPFHRSIKKIIRALPNELVMHSLQADAFINRLAADSEEQLRYNAVINSIVNYKDHNEYKYKTSFKYKVMKFLKLTK